VGAKLKMNIMQLTVQDIKEDISEFEKRIQAARQKLALLPVGHLPLKEHKKREQVRRDLVGKVHHIKTLIKFANEGIEILFCYQRKSKRSTKNFGWQDKKI
jgi:hypothetical protein